jgi:uncharacterized membrane protein
VSVSSFLKWTDVPFAIAMLTSTAKSFVAGPWWIVAALFGALLIIAWAVALLASTWLLAVGVGLLSPLSYILVLAALDIGVPLSVVAPAREMSMMIGALFGMLVLREAVGVWRLVGCAVLVGGVVLLGS